MPTSLPVRAAILVSALAFGCAANPNGMDAGDPPRDAGGRRDSGDVPGFDSGRPDAGTSDGGATSDAGAGMDASASDAGAMGDGGGADAGGADAGGSDGGGTVAITVDGVIGAAEWAGATSATNTVATAWTNNELHRMLADVRGGTLYLAVEGTVETVNAIVVYVDHGLGSGTGIAALTDLTDTSGALDNTISPNGVAWTVPSTFRADYAWGTRRMSSSAGPSDDFMGWRDVSTNPADFGFVDTSVAPTVCSATACETSIPLSTLGGTAPRSFALFARINDAFGAASSNQTLPMDDALNPRTVMNLLTFSE